MYGWFPGHSKNGRDNMRIPNEAQWEARDTVANEDQSHQLYAM